MEEELSLGMKVRVLGYAIGFAIVLVAFEVFMLALLAKGSDCEAMSTGVLVASGVGALCLALPVFYLALMIVAIDRKRDMF